MTSLCSYERQTDKRTIVVSGDAGGEMIVSEAFFSAIGKFEKIEPIFKRRSQNGQISKIERYTHEDIILTACHDGSMVFWDIEKQQKILELSEHDQPIFSFQFMDDFNYLSSATRYDLLIWNLSFQERAGTGKQKDDPSKRLEDDEEDNYEARFIITAKIVNTLDFDEKGSLFSYAKVFGTNLRSDYLLFVAVGSDIKLLNILKGKYIGDIDGAHFKGTNNFGLMVNSGPTSRIKSTLSRINQVVNSGDQMDMLKLFVEQLNDYVLLTASSKDKLRIWKFDDAYSSPVSQAGCLGGFLDSQIFLINNRQGEVCVLTCGNCSNKIELFTLNN